MIVQSIDGDSLVLTKTELSEQGQNSDFGASGCDPDGRTKSYVRLVDLGPALNARSSIGLYPVPGGWRSPNRAWMTVGAGLSPKMGTIGCKAFGEEATKKIRKAVRAALKAKKGSKKKKK